MEKKVTNIKNSNKKLVISLSVVAVLAVTSTGLILENAINKDENNESLEFYLETYGIEEGKNMSIKTSGYHIGYQDSFYQTNYDLNTNSDVTSKKEIYDKLKDIYSGENSKYFKQGLKDGINDGYEEAEEQYQKKVKTR